jgi:hypothetical protein
MMAQLIMNEFSIKKEIERQLRKWVCEKREKAAERKREK